MKKLVFLCISFGIYFTLFGNNLQDSLNKSINDGNTLYQNGKYDEALTKYFEAFDSGFESSLLFYNIGNAFYKSKDVGNAILWYERALKLDPANEDVKHNIAFVNQKIEDKIEILPKLFIVEWYQQLLNLLNSNQWAILSIFFSFGIVLSILGFLFVPINWIKSTSIILGSLFVILTFFSIHSSLILKNINEKQSEAIVMQSVIIGKSTPDNNGTELFVIHEGLKVTITDQFNEWYEIKLPNGEKGWVKYSEIEKI